MSMALGNAKVQFLQAFKNIAIAITIAIAISIVIALPVYPSTSNYPSEKHKKCKPQKHSNI